MSITVRTILNMCMMYSQCNNPTTPSIFPLGNGTEDIVRRYSHPSRLFFFSLHLYEKEDGGQQPQHSSHQPAAVKTTTDRPIDAVTTEAAAAPSAASPAARKYEFYPGTGVKDDHVSGKYRLWNRPFPF